MESYEVEINGKVYQGMTFVAIFIVNFSLCVWRLILFLLNIHLFQKLKLIRICKFNYLINTFNTFSCVGLKSPTSEV
jgi:hypothetical protein